MGSDSKQEYGCSTGLSLDLLIGFTANSNNKDPNQKPCLKFDHVLPALSLGPVDRAALSTSPGSSSNNSSCEKKRSLDQAGKELVGSSVDQVDEDEEDSPRKKLRLTKEQSAVLEDTFKQHTTLNPNQKEALARRLNLRPRQVEVWFQNRRARTKLKQTEMECQVLKKFCEKLTQENKRLHKELHELKTLKLAAPAVYMQMPAATLSMCPSCERFTAPSPVDGGGGSGVAVFSGGMNTPLIFTTHPSAAC